MTCLVPDTGEHLLYLSQIQQSWQKNVAAYVNIKQTTIQDIESRFQSGEYELLLLPFTPAGPRIETLLKAFTTGSSQNRFGYYNARYDELPQQALDTTSLGLAAFRFSQAEKTLLADAVVIPVYTETSYYAMGKGVTGIEVFPFGNKVIFKDGVRP